MVRTQQGSPHPHFTRFLVRIIPNATQLGETLFTWLDRKNWDTSFQSPAPPKNRHGRRHRLGSERAVMSREVLQEAPGSPLKIGPELG